MHEIQKRERYCYIVCTKFSSGKGSLNLEPWKSIQESLQKVSYEKVITSWKTFDATKKPEAASNLDEVSSDIHAFLDNLSQNGSHEYMLDIILLTDVVPGSKKMPGNLFGSFKRAVEWHGASILIMSNKSDAKYSSYLHELSVNVTSMDPENLQDFIDSNLFWRGTLAFFDDSNMSYLHLGKCELVNEDFSNTDETVKDVQLSQRLKIISKCSMTTIPSYFFTKSKLILRSASASPISDKYSSSDFFNDPTIFGDGNCVIAKLERSVVKNNQGFRLKKNNQRTTESWKKAVLDGSYAPEIDKDLIGKSLEPIFMIIYYDPKVSTKFHERKCLESRCIILDYDTPLATQAKSYEVVTDTFLAKDSSPVNVIGKV